MRLQLCTWPEVERYLETSRGVIVPIGSTEQHGPNGLIGTDALCAEAIAWTVGEVHRVLVAPSLSIGVAQFNLAFPGTVSVRAATLMALIEDVVLSLGRHGFERIYFLNGHGGNIAPLRAVFQDIYWPYSMAGEIAAVRCHLRSWWEYPRTDGLRRELYAAKEGMHATPSEVAITRHLFPQAAKTSQGLKMAAAEALDADFLRDHGGDNHLDASSHRQRFADGRVGSEPSLATAEAGERLLTLAAEEAYSDYQAFLGNR